MTDNIVITIYPGPDSPANFFSEFQILIETLASITWQIFVIRDFKLHVDKISAHVITFNDILSSFDIKQHLNFLVHKHGPWLLPFLTRSTCNKVKSVLPSDCIAEYRKLSHLIRKSEYPSSQLTTLTLMPVTLASTNLI